MTTSRMLRPRGRSLGMSLLAIAVSAFVLAGCSAGVPDGPGNCENGWCPLAANASTTPDTSSTATATDSPSPSDTATTAPTPTVTETVVPSDIPTDITVTPGTNRINVAGQEMVIRADQQPTATVTATVTATPPATKSSTSKSSAPAPTKTTASTAPAKVAGVTAGQGSAPTGNLSKQQLDAVCVQNAGRTDVHADLDTKYKPLNTAWSWSCYDSSGNRLFDGGMSIDGYCGAWQGYTSNKAKPTDPPYAWTCVKL